MKKIIAIILSALVVISFSAMALGCGDSGSSSSSSGSYKTKADRDAEYIGDQYGVDSDYVKDSAERMADAMR